MVAGSVKTLMRMNNSKCHYCGCKTNINDIKKNRGHGAKYPTKDHVVPRAFGGANHISNYVLACAECNNKRGTSLFFCSCRDCRELILDAIYDNSVIDTILAGIEKHNRPRVYKGKYAPSNPASQKPWTVSLGHNRRVFATYDEAIDFALNGACVKDIDY